MTWWPATQSMCSCDQRSMRSRIDVGLRKPLTVHHALIYFG
jgi:hypothetical protein